MEFCADFSNKPKPVKAIYILHLKFLITLFQKMILWKKYMNKSGHFSSFHVSFLSYGSQIVKFFWNFVLTSARNLSLLKQVRYRIWKFSWCSFRKWYLLLIGVWTNKILAIKISKILVFQTLISQKQQAIVYNKQLPFSQSAQQDLSDAYM